MCPLKYSENRFKDIMLESLSPSKILTPGSSVCTIRFVSVASMGVSLSAFDTSSSSCDLDEMADFVESVCVSRRGM